MSEVKSDYYLKVFEQKIIACAHLAWKKFKINDKKN